jgi:hypothetical protein
MDQQVKLRWLTREQIPLLTLEWAETVASNKISVEDVCQLVDDYVDWLDNVNQ